MNNRNQLFSLLLLWLPIVPFLVIYLVGVVLSVIRWQRQPLTARLAFFAFVLLLLRTCIGMGARWFTVSRDSFGLDMKTMTLYLGIINGFETMIAMVAWILLLLALFLKRDV